MRRFPLLLMVVAVAITAYAVVALAQGPETGQAAPPDQEDGYMMMGGMMGGTSIAVSGKDIYVVAGGMLLKYDQDLKLVKQVELPVSESMKRWHEMNMQRMGGGMVGEGMAPGMGRGRGGPGMREHMRGGGGMRGDGGGMRGDGGGMMGGGRMMRGGGGMMREHWGATLSPMQGVTTDASAQASFWLSRNGLMLRYVLDVEDIKDATQAHIHMVKDDQPGEPVAFLFKGPEKKGAFTGILAQGTITAAELMGPLKGKPLSDLVDALDNGGAMVVVHTTAAPAGALDGFIE
jgi:hypothetical protein